MGTILGSLGQLLQFALEIYSWMVIIRVLISWVSPDPYNPIVQFLVRATEPLLYPIRRMMPTLGGLDFSPIVALLAIFAAQRLVGVLFQGQEGGFAQLGIELITVVHLLGTLYMVLLLVRGGLNLYSWHRFRTGRPFRLDLRNQGALFLYQVTEPALRPLRSWVPAPRGLDLSPLAAALLVVVGLLLLQEVIHLLSTPQGMSLPGEGMGLPGEGIRLEGGGGPL